MKQSEAKKISNNRSNQRQKLGESPVAECSGDQPTKQWLGRGKQTKEQFDVLAMSPR